MKAYMILAAAVAASLLAGCAQRGYVQLTGYAQGGTWSVKYNTDGVTAGPAEVQRGIEAILHDIDTTLSGYNMRSQLSRLNAGDTVTASRMLMRMYNRSHAFWQETEGAVDVAAGPLFDIWGFGFRNDSLPSGEKVREALSVSGMGRLVPSMEEVLMPGGRLCAARLQAIRPDGAGSLSGAESLPCSGGHTGSLPRLNFNAIAQGYSCDTVASYLNSLGVKDMLVDIGEILCRGLGPSGKPWRVGVDRPADGNNTPGADLDGIWESAGIPRDGLSAGDRAAGDSDRAEEDGLPFQGIVTSGNYRKFYLRDGHKYAHTIDPRTGYPAENELLSATIVASSAEAADAYATYCMVIGLEAAKRFILGRPDLEGYLIYDVSASGMAEWKSPGFRLAE